MFPAGRSDLSVRFLALASGRRVRIVECGPLDGKPLLLLHGWACSAYTFRKNYAALARAGYRVNAPDLRGHGLSDKPLDATQYTLAAMAEHAIEIMDALGAARTAVVGHSMGAAIALQVALQAPERVPALVLLGPVGFGVISLLHLARVLTPSTLKPLLPYLTPRWAFALALRWVFGGGEPPTRRDVDEYWAPTQFREWVCAMRELLHAFTWAPGREDQLRVVRSPTLVMFGCSDRVVQPSAAEKYVRALPDARLETVEGSGHTVPEAAPARVNRAMVEFLGERYRVAIGGATS